MKMSVGILVVSSTEMEGFVIVLLTQHYLVWFSAYKDFPVQNPLSDHCCGLFLDHAALQLVGL